MSSRVERNSLIRRQRNTELSYVYTETVEQEEYVETKKQAENSQFTPKKTRKRQIRTKNRNHTEYANNKRH